MSLSAPRSIARHSRRERPFRLGEQIASTISSPRVSHPAGRCCATVRMKRLPSDRAGLPANITPSLVICLSLLGQNLGQNPFCSFAKNGGIIRVFRCAEGTGRWIRTLGPALKETAAPTRAIWVSTYGCTGLQRSQSPEGPRVRIRPSSGEPSAAGGTGLRSLGPSPGPR